jgi:ribonuclease J
MTTPGNELLFLALGGSDEIGMNANLYGCQGKWIMVDLGVTFGNSDYPGIDLVFPDLEFIEDRKKDLLGIILTHAHEDHIGAVPYFAAELGVPLYATRFTAEMIRRKLEEEGIEEQVELNILPMEAEFELGVFKCKFVTLAHSIPEMSAVLIDTPHGKVFHTGDWKLDDEPVIGTPSTAEQLEAIGKSGVLAMVCDSTNAFNAEASGSEGSVRADLIKSVVAAKGRVVVTSFASNAARIQTLADVAKAAGRRLCLAGRSLQRIVEVGQASGILKNLPPLIDMMDVDSVPRNKLLIVATGGQGEARAALARIAEGTHPIKLDEGDTVIFSSRQIPGNEINIGRVMNNLARRNVRTVTEKQVHIHVSGHPAQPELAAMYKWIRPQMLIPVHGERRHMAEQARFAIAQGVPRTLVQSNGDVVRIAPNGPEIVERQRTGRLVLDGDRIIPADGGAMSERRKLALNGVISAGVALDAAGKLLDVEFRMQGVPVDLEDRQDWVEDAVAAVREALTRGGDKEKVREAVRLAVRRTATEWTGKKPIVDVMLLQIG